MLNWGRQKYRCWCPAAGVEGLCREGDEGSTGACGGRSIHPRPLSATSICRRFVPAMCQFVRAGVDSVFFRFRSLVNREKEADKC